MARTHIAMHLRGFTQKDIHRHLDSPFLALTPFDNEHVVVANCSQNRIRAPLAPANRIESLQILRGNRKSVALLAFVTPDFQGAHALFQNRHSFKREACPVAR